MIYSDYNSSGFLFVAGIPGHPGRVAWSDRNDPTSFKFDDTLSEAGWMDLTDERIVGLTGERVHTDRGTWEIKFVGHPFIFAFDKVSDLNPDFPESRGPITRFCFQRLRDGKWTFADFQGLDGETFEQGLARMGERFGAENVRPIYGIEATDEA